MKKKTAYLIGIKGVAMTSLAIYLKQAGYNLAGSDVEDEFHTDLILKRHKIKVKKGFTAENINKKYELVAVTGAHGGMTNIEAKKAKKLSCPVFMHGQVLGKLMEGKEGISVAGCHGKTTTSSLVASLLSHAGYDPSCAIGVASINDLGEAGHFGKGRHFVVEADEYMTCPLTEKKPRFLWQNPKIAIITNIEYDHPDAFASINEVKSAFLAFAGRLKNDGVLIACIDDKNVRDILSLTANTQVLTYGFSPQADFRIESFYFGEGISFMKVSFRGMHLGEFMLCIPGRHNLLNALAASIAANLVGVSWDKIKDYLKLFTGTKRRFEKVFQEKGLMLYDDYAHHPTEIVATIKGARGWFPGKKLIVIFQPHTFSRTKALLSDFSRSFQDADLAVISDIYPSAREKFDSSINSNILVSKISTHKKNAVYKPNKESVLEFLRGVLSDNDLIITMGAGDIFSWHGEIIRVIKEHK